jgi:hypothetical protein
MTATNGLTPEAAAFRVLVEFAMGTRGLMRIAIPRLAAVIGQGLTAVRTRVRGFCTCPTRINKQFS